MHVDRNAPARATRIAAAAAFATVFLGLLAPLLFGLTYYGIDLSRADVGVACALRDQMNAGVPLFTSPLLGNGSPWLVNPTARLLYPLRFLEVMLPVDLGVSVYVALHLALGAASLTWLARTFRVGALTAAPGGIIFALTGTALDTLQHPMYVLDVTWIPCAWAACRTILAPRTQRKFPRFSLLIMGVSIAALLLGQEPQALIIIAVVVSVEVALAAWRLRKSTTDRQPMRALAARVTRLGVVCVGGLFIGLFAWLPAFVELALTPRASMLSVGEAMHWSYDELAWLATLVPLPVAAFVHPIATVSEVYVGALATQLAWNPQPYVGLLLLFAMLLGAKQRTTRSLVVVGVVFLVFALGPHVRVLPLIQQVVPLLARLRYPAKYLVVVDIAVVLLALRGLHAALRSRTSLRHLRIAAAVGAGLALLGFVVAFLSADRFDAIAAQLSPAATTTLPRVSDLVLRALAHVVIVLAAAAACASFKFRRWLIVVVVVDLALTLPSQLRLGAPLEPLHSPLAALNGDNSFDDKRPVVCIDVHLDRVTTRSDAVPSHWDQDAAARVLGVRELQSCDGLRTPVSYGPLATRLQKKLEAGISAGSAVAGRALGCDYMLLRGALREGHATLVDPSSLGLDRFAAFQAAKLYRIDRPIAELQVLQNPELVSNEDALLKRLRENDVDVENLIDDPLARIEGSRTLPAAQATHQITDVRYVDGMTVFSVTGEGSAVVVERRAFHVGYEAWQGTTRLPILRSSGQHVAIVIDDVTRGPIDISYRIPRSALISTLAVLGLCLMVVAQLRLRVVKQA